MPHLNTEDFNAEIILILSVAHFLCRSHTRIPHDYADTLVTWMSTTRHRVDHDYHLVVCNITIFMWHISLTTIHKSHHYCLQCYTTNEFAYCGSYGSIVMVDKLSIHSLTRILKKVEIQLKLSWVVIVLKFVSPSFSLPVILQCINLL